MKKIIFILYMLFSMSVISADNIIDDGDLVRVSVYGNPDLTIEAKITSQGILNFPLIGEVKVGGLSAPEAEQRIATRLVEEGFLTDAQVNLIVLQSNSQQVSILGHVMKPGKYSIEPGAKTLFDFIALSGGVSVKGSYEIVVIRMGVLPPKRVSVDLNQLFLKSDVDVVLKINIEMMADDIIYVPEAPMFYVYGEANRPGVYRFKSGMTVAQAIASSGGVSSKGTVRDLVITRKTEQGQLKFLGASLSDEILANDTITIKESFF